MKVKARFLFLAIFLLSSVSIFAQQRVRIKKSEFKIINTGFKDAWKAVRQGNKYFDEGPGTYRDARKEYLKAYRYNPNNAELNYMIGVCFIYSDDKFESIKYLKKSYKIKPNVTPDIRFMLGRAYHLVLDFDNAILEYTEYRNNLPPKILVLKSGLINQLITQCRNGIDLVSDPVRVVISNPGKNINSEYDDYNPVISRDESVMFFTSRRMAAEKSSRNPVDNKFYEDIYVSQKKINEWGTAKRFDKKINKNKNKENNAAVGLSADNKELYSYKGKSNSGDLFKSVFKNGKWTKPHPLPGKINSKYRETSLCFSSDEKTMYFVSSNKKTSLGGLDIYVCKKDYNGKWGNPENMGSMINTAFDEVAVSLSANDSILFFSSDGHNTMGGYDIFNTKKSETGLWSKPENIGYPINTPDDDVFFVLAPDGKTAYYSTIRENGIGGKDIYKVIYLGAEKEMILSDEGELIAGLQKPPDNIFFKEPEKLAVDTSLIMKGMITDSEDQQPVIAKLEVIDVDVSRVIATAISDASGNYKLNIPAPKTYGVEIIAKNYLLYLDAIDLSKESSDEIIIRNFMLERVEVGAKVILKNIFFEFGKSTLKSESFTELNNVIKLLQNNETLRIEISGHTDNIGTYKYNKKLSEDRAKAVVDYLIKKGITQNRLEYKGYAYDQPVAPNTTEEGRAQNRRVEFKVLSK
jgi:outer membrane protein OmpA-like peptidoglycan-associated protein/tetratricopeptide (TPR) repeat protein